MKIKEIDALSFYQLKPLAALMFRFIVEAKEDEATVEAVMQRFNECQGKWLVINKGKVHGYFMATIQKNIYGKLFTFVENAYLHPSLRMGEAVHLIEKTIAEWTKKQGLKQIVFTTRRHAKAFQRLLGRKYVIDSVVLSACA